ARVAVAHQSGQLEDAKVLRDGRLRDPRLGCQRADGLFALAAKALEDRPPGRVGKRSEEPIVRVRHWIDNCVAMNRSITAQLWVSQGASPPFIAGGTRLKVAA